MEVSFVFRNSFSKKLVYNRNAWLKIDCAASTGNHGKDIKYVSFLWPPLMAAHGPKEHARVLLSGISYWLSKEYLYSQDSVMYIRFYLSLTTAQKTISQQITFAVTIGKVQG